MYSWGMGHMGQLGMDPPLEVSPSGFQLNTPTIVPWQYEAHPIKTISGGMSHTVALTGTLFLFLLINYLDKGKVVVWGWYLFFSSNIRDANGRLGFDKPMNAGSYCPPNIQVKPVIIPFFAEKVARTAVAGGQFTMVVLGMFFIRVDSI